MANNNSGIIQIFTAGTTSTDKFHVPRGGVVGLDLVRTSGTGTVSLEFSLDGTTYVPCRDEDGSLVTVAMDGTTEHYHKRLLAQVDTYFQLVTTSMTSTPSISAKMTRIISE